MRNIDGWYQVPGTRSAYLEIMSAIVQEYCILCSMLQ